MGKKIRLIGRNHGSFKYTFVIDNDISKEGPIACNSNNSSHIYGTISSKIFKPYGTLLNLKSNLILF